MTHLESKKFQTIRWCIWIIDVVENFFRSHAWHAWCWWLNLTANDIEISKVRKSPENHRDAFQPLLLSESQAAWQKTFHILLILKWFGFISSFAAFLSHVVLLRHFPPPFRRRQSFTSDSHISRSFSRLLCSHPQDRQMIVFSISLFISPHNLWIIFQHFSTSARSHNESLPIFWKIFSRKIPDNKILLVKQIFEHFPIHLGTRACVCVL